MKTTAPAWLVFIGLAMATIGQAQERFRIIETGMETRDGVNLKTFVYLPADEGPFPTLIYRTPYGVPFNTLGGFPRQENRETARRPAEVGWPAITDRGYALVVQYTRGRTGSEGEDRIFTTDREDGADLVAWIERRPWSNGRIGVLGDSAYGITSLLLASANPPGLDAAYVQVATGDLFDKTLLGPGGALAYEFTMPWMAEQAMNADPFHYEAIGYPEAAAASVRAEVRARVDDILAAAEGGSAATSPIWRHLPLIEHPAVAPALPLWVEMLNAGFRSDWTGALDTSSGIEVPMLHIGMWYDVFNTAMMETFMRTEARTGNQRFVIMDGTHYAIDDPSAWPIFPMIPWFDYWLKDDAEAIEELPKIAFAVSASPGEWYASPSWPPSGVETRTFYLHADGSLGDQTPVRDAPSRSYVYDPDNPVPTLGGRNLYIAAGPMDQRPVEPPNREDVLVYTGERLDEDVVIAGRMRINLSASSNRPDTDFTAKLIDRYPNGTTMLVADGIVRARYREGGPEQRLLEPGQVYSMPIELGHIAYRFRAGHRIQVDVSSSNFPRWDRNTNTGGPLYRERTTAPAANRIHHDNVNPSSLELPVLVTTDELEPISWPERE
ncbi:MAG: CocE/NonD family hydrolase [Gammaproteobacteria bacterium]|nr:CocE/NonD family hydrolase [Gammaproteobacteria bacterium]MDH3506442.1 CocE/NonD family hydrolase [Gammaproteobacteria bacterium]